MEESMENFYLWVTKHKLSAGLLFSALLCAVYTVFLVWLRAPLWVIITVDIITVLVNYFFVFTCHGKLIRKAESELDNNCDPYPLLYITELLLNYKYTDFDRFLLLLDHCASLASVGEPEKAYGILESINIDNITGAFPAIKIIYYNNLMGVSASLGMTDKANELHSKIMMMYQSIGAKKQKQLLEPIIHMAEAVYCYYNQEYAKSIQLLNGMESNVPRMKVVTAMLCANACLGLNDTETAKEKLRYVIDHGNRLFSVTEARDLLNKLH